MSRLGTFRSLQLERRFICSTLLVLLAVSSVGAQEYDHNENPPVGDVRRQSGPLRRLLDQEENILGYMAKLVALDATALSEQVMESELAEADVPEATGVTEAVGFFVSR